METLTFEQLPYLVADLKKEVEEMKALLLQKAEPQLETDNPLNIKDVAILTGLSVATIYLYCQRNTIPYYKKANRLFFFESELKDWIKTGKQRTLEELEADAEGYLSKKKTNQLKLF